MSFPDMLGEDAVVNGGLIDVSVDRVGHVGGQVACFWSVGMVTIKNA
jgi:hypothetical protein